MQPTEFAPGDGFHLCRRVELHRARAERDHAAVESVVLVSEALEEAHHRRFASVRVEHGVREDFVTAHEGRLDGCVDKRRRGGRLLGGQSENRVEQHIVSARKNSGCITNGQFVERQLNRVRVDDVKQHSTRVC